MQRQTDNPTIPELVAIILSGTDEVGTQTIRSIVGSGVKTPGGVSENGSGKDVLGDYSVWSCLV